MTKQLPGLVLQVDGAGLQLLRLTFLEIVPHFVVGEELLAGVDVQDGSAVDVLGVPEVVAYHVLLGFAGEFGHQLTKHLELAVRYPYPLLQMKEVHMYCKYFIKTNEKLKRRHIFGH